jgi:hypothetical protein
MLEALIHQQGGSTPKPFLKSHALEIAPLIFIVMDLLFTGCDRIDRVLNQIRGEDWIQFSNGENSSNGALVDGMQGGTVKNDYIPIPTNAGYDMRIGFFTSSGPNEPGEVIAFTKGRPPTIKTVEWTGFSDSVEVKYRKPYAISVYVWIVAGDTTAQRNKALLACAETERIWKEERQGIRFSSFNISDQFINQGLNRFSCTHNNVAAIKANNRYHQGAINIYYVDSVLDPNDFYSQSDGVHCGSALDHQYDDVIVVGSNASPALLAHEIGHAFSLGHVGGARYAPFFDETNVMHESSDTRRYLTEGQTFRQVIDTDSAINKIYGLQPESRDCYEVLGITEEEGWFGTAGTPEAEEGYKNHLRQCPLLQTRIWQDGRRWLSFWEQLGGYVPIKYVPVQ